MVLLLKPFPDNLLISSHQVNRNHSVLDSSLNTGALSKDTSTTSTAKTGTDHKKFLWMPLACFCLLTASVGKKLRSSHYFFFPPKKKLNKEKKKFDQLSMTSDRVCWISLHWRDCLETETKATKKSVISYFSSFWKFWKAKH